MADNPETYQAYLVRFRRRDESQSWRVTVVQVGTEQELHFASLEVLVAFLRTQLDTDQDHQPRQGNQP